MHELVAQRLFERDIAGLNGRTCKIRKWTLFSKEYPHLDIGFEAEDRKPLRLRLNCRDYDMSSPSIELMNWNGSFREEAILSPTGIFHPGPHPHTGRIFVCMAGSREYHQHESHVADSWFNYRRRDGFDIAGIVFQIWRGWVKGSE